MIQDFISKFLKWCATRPSMIVKKPGTCFGQGRCRSSLLRSDFRRQKRIPKRELTNSELVKELRDLAIADPIVTTFI